MRYPIFLFCLIVYVSGASQSLFPGKENGKEVIRNNKIAREIVFNYTFRKDKIVDSAIDATFLYDSKGDLIEEKKEKTRNTRETVTKNTYLYNAENKLIKQITEIPTADMVSNYEYEYDSLGNEITKYVYNRDTSRLTVEQKVYNTKNQVLELWMKINASESFYSRRYSYNENGELTQIDAYNPKGENIYSYIYENDKTLNKKTLYLKNEDGKRVQDVCIYNTDSLPIKFFHTSRRQVYLTSSSQELENFEQATEYVYNPDKTVFQTISYLDGKKIKIQKHYYFKF